MSDAFADALVALALAAMLASGIVLIGIYLLLAFS